jgi:D-alanyl-D-alanine carboxypeptidase (penicillin-binding protein 5/6)
MSKVRFSLIVAACLAVAVAGRSVAAPSGSGGYNTSVPYAILVEAETGTVLFEKAADQLVPPASLAKLMTAEVVFDQVALGNVKMDEEFVVSENAWRKGGAPSGGSTMFAAIHSKIKVSDLLSGVVIQSGNDAAIVLAEGISGNESSFARLMNDRARELGLEKSNFANSTGMHDPQQRVTVRELAKLTQHIIRTYPEYYKLYGERDFTWNKIRQQNRNPLLAMNLGADGLKTGFIKESGYGLVGSAVQNGLRLIVVVHGAKHEKERADEARKLLEWGFKGFETRLLFAEGQTVAYAKVYGGARGSVPVTGKGPINLMVPRGVSDRITAKMVYTGPVRAPVQLGQPIGTLQVWRNETLALEAPLQASEDVETGGTARRAFDAASELVINALRAGVGKL